MRRVAAHYIWYRQVCRMHYLELDDKGCLSAIHPLVEEIAGTEFYDGILLPIPEKSSHTFEVNLHSFLEKGADLSEEGSVFLWIKHSKIWEAIAAGEPVRLFLLNRTNLAASEFGTDNGSGNCHIQRL